jgi:chromosomal replication initiation ATPase DnaA
MKHNIFNQYVNKISELFRLEPELLFSKTKKREVVEARYLLYYLCAKRPMSIMYIQKYMHERGYIINHSTINYGISVVENRLDDDRDYVTVVRDIKESVFI